MLFGTSVVHFVLPHRNLLINVFGESCPRDMAQAQRLAGWLESLGFNYLELTDADVFDSPRCVIEAIESYSECKAAHQRWLASRCVVRRYELSEHGESLGGADDHDE